jgi:transketolase
MSIRNAPSSERPRVLDPARYRFRIDEAYVLREGGKLGMISTGFMTERALDAVDELASLGIEVSILPMPTIKSLVAETLFEAGIQRRMTRVGIPDRSSNAASCPTCRRNAG